jgi:hypothetical protein
MGNRGILHNERQQLIRPYKLKAWIICQLQFKGRRRPLMQPGRYTELFFLDEATALAAGHRPCFECQRERALAFRQAWQAGNQAILPDSPLKVTDIDNILHEERLTSARLLKDKKKKVFTAVLNSLPAGTFVGIASRPYLIWAQQLFLWTPGGYHSSHLPLNEMPVCVLTPPSTVKALAQGFVPVTHSSLADPSAKNI